MNTRSRSHTPSRLLAIGGGLLLAASAHAGITTDANGNVGYDTAAECDAAVLAGTARFYKPFTEHPPLQRAGEASVRAMRLSELAQATETARLLGYNAADYARGACDLGVGRSNGRDGVSGELIGKYVPYGPQMSVNVYFDRQGTAVRATMQQCDNNFAKALPRPVGVPLAAAPSECFANVLVPARFETRTEQVIKTPETRRTEPVPATFRTVTEQVMVAPETRRQIPVPATYKTVTEEVVVKPASFREEPVPPTYKTVSERMLVKPESKRLEVTQPTYKTVSEQVMVTPERKELRVIPAVYGEKDETVELRPVSTRVETVAATYKTESERVLARAESVRYEPIALPMKTVTEQKLRSQASSRLEATPPTYKTVTERVVVRAEHKRLVPVPAVFETVTEQVMVAEATRQWKQGRAYIGQAIEVRPLRTFLQDGKADTSLTGANNATLDDDVMCLVEVPARYETVTRQVLKTPATVREELIPAEYGEVSRLVLDKPAGTQSIDIPATQQTVYRMVVDVDKLKAQGYKFNEKGDVVATPSGDRLLRASDVPSATGSVVPAKTAGAASGEEGYVREIKIPAEYTTITRQVVDKPATVREISVPGETQIIKTRVVVTPAKTEEIVIPAVFKTITRQVPDKQPEVKEVVIPAEYRTVTRQVEDTVATTRRIPVPEVRETVKRQVIDQPAGLREEVTPAKFQTITRQVVDVPASVREFVVPAQYEKVTYQVKIADALTERRQVLCDTNATPAKIREIQQALSKAGYNPGPINGQLRQGTMNAVSSFQKAKGLPVDGFLSIDTVRALGVSPN